MDARTRDLWVWLERRRESMAAKAAECHAQGLHMTAQRYEGMMDALLDVRTHVESTERGLSERDGV